VVSHNGPGIFFCAPLGITAAGGVAAMEGPPPRGLFSYDWNYAVLGKAVGGKKRRQAVNASCANRGRDVGNEELSAAWV